MLDPDSYLDLELVLDLNLDPDRLTLIIWMLDLDSDLDF